MEPYQKFYRVIAEIHFFTSAVFAALTPPVLLALLGKWLCGRFGWNRIVLALLVLFGIACGLTSMFSFFRKTEALQKQAKREQKEDSVTETKKGGVS